MTKIYNTLSDPEVPRGGTIRESVGWEGVAPSGITHTFYLHSFYGAGTTMEEILSQVVAHNYITSEILGPGQALVSEIDAPITEDAPLGTFSCLTIIAEDFAGVLMYDSRIDVDVLTITPGLGATIMDVGFASV